MPKESFFIQDFKLVERKEKKIVSVTAEGLITLCSLSYDLKKICTRNSHKIQLISERKEKPFSLAVCDQGKYLMVGVIQSPWGNWGNSRVLVFRLKNRLIDPLPLGVRDDQYWRVEEPSKTNFEFCRRFGKVLIWVGLSDVTAFIYCLDCESGQLRELVERRVYHGELEPLKIHRIDEGLYYTGEDAKVMKITVKI